MNLGEDVCSGPGHSLSALLPMAEGTVQGETEGMPSLTHSPVQHANLEFPVNCSASAIHSLPLLLLPQHGWPEGASLVRPRVPHPGVSPPGAPHKPRRARGVFVDE